MIFEYLQILCLENIKISCNAKVFMALSAEISQDIALISIKQSS